MNEDKKRLWAELEERYPEEVGRFKDWVDGYKERVGWAELFAPRQFVVDGAQEERRPKFHELPLEMQVGIFGLYAFERERSEQQLGELHEELLEAVGGWFERRARRQLASDL